VPPQAIEEAFAWLELGMDVWCAAKRRFGQTFVKCTTPVCDGMGILIKQGPKNGEKLANTRCGSLGRVKFGLVAVKMVGSIFGNL